MWDFHFGPKLTLTAWQDRNARSTLRPLEIIALFTLSEAAGVEIAAIVGAQLEHSPHHAPFSMVTGGKV